MGWTTYRGILFKGWSRFLGVEKVAVSVGVLILQENGPFWSTFFRNERVLFSLHQCPIPHKSLNLFGVRDVFIQRLFSALINFWQSIEVLGVWGTELPMVLTYKADIFVIPRVGGGHVNQIFREVLFVLSIRCVLQLSLWVLFPDMNRSIWELNFPSVFGCPGNADEMLRLLRVIDRTNFAVLHDSWTAPIIGRSMAPGRRDRGADGLCWTCY